MKELGPDDCPLCGLSMKGESLGSIGYGRKTDAHIGCASDWWVAQAEARQEAS